MLLVRGAVEPTGPHLVSTPMEQGTQDLHIWTTKELAPIVLATAIWGKVWHGHTIRVLSDNTVAVTAVNNSSSELQETAHLLHCLAFLTANY